MLTLWSKHGIISTRYVTHVPTHTRYISCKSRATHPERHQDAVVEHDIMYLLEILSLSLLHVPINKLSIHLLDLDKITLQLFNLFFLFPKHLKTSLISLLYLSQL